jgi:hypothetical protein
MYSSRLLKRSLMILSLLIIEVSIFAQEQPVNDQFEPQSGQEGKDVVWVPTPQELVDKMLDMAKITPQDNLIDLGSGDGRTVISAAKRGTRAKGIEYNPDMVALSRRNAAREGVSAKCEFVKADLFESDLSKATVITMFLLPDINLRLRPELLDLKPGTRIVSNTFTMDEWIPDDTVMTDEYNTSWNTAYLWIIPAKVEGDWRMPQGELKLKQTFQMISGSLMSKGKKSTITDGKLIGNKITFLADGAQYSGQVNGETIEGTIASYGIKGVWNATRIIK